MADRNCREYRQGKVPALRIMLALLLAGLISVSAASAYAEEVAGPGAPVAAEKTADPGSPVAAEKTADPGSPEAADIASDPEAPPVAFAEDDFNDVYNITFPFLDTETVAYEWSFPYSDEFFRLPSDRFSRTMAKGSLGFAASAFRSTKEVVDPQYRTYLEGAGFRDLKAFGYDQETTQDSLSGIIGSKKIDGFTVIAVTTCGQGYGNEWAGNLRVGAGDVHQGFSEASRLLQSHLTDYIEDHNITGKKKIWFAGISRAAAVANVAAADLIDSGDYEDVYAYLFGVPRTTKNPVAYSGIYNIMGQFDPVTDAPLQAWGFERFGRDLYTPAEEMNTDYVRLASTTSRTTKKLTGKRFRNNPEINYQLHLILEFMGEFFPTSEEYADRFQDILMQTWKTPDFEHMEKILAAAFAQMKDLKGREKYSSLAFINYVTMIAAEHTRANSRQIEDESWDPTESLAANVVLEHRPSTYVNWLFSENPSKDILLRDCNTRRIVFIGEMSIEVYKDGMLLESISPGGKVTYMDDVVDAKTAAEVKKASRLPELFMMKNGREYVISVPDDAAYRLVIRTQGSKPMTYYDVMFTSSNLKGTAGNMYVTTLSRGEFGLDIVPGMELPPLEEISGRVHDLKADSFQYSPITTMIEETENSGNTYMTLNMMLDIAAYSIGLMNIVLLVCLVIFIVNRRRKRRGEGPFSHWYVITPHLFIVGLFTGLTLLMTYYMVVIGAARAECASATVFVIFLLALRGTIRNRTWVNVITTAGLLLFAVLLQHFYGEIPQDRFGLVNILVCCAITAGLCLLAIRTFYGTLRIRRTPASDDVPE